MKEVDGRRDPIYRVPRAEGHLAGPTDATGAPPLSAIKHFDKLIQQWL
jgi:hypothetical protein